ncbi:hypothetical protein GQ42DRAFT_124531 [Ramicandelaber brevisporus]|nr:hypothetical protein GQ42DRAFT_124531 [Ramicandelaber brevisporus]
MVRGRSSGGSGSGSGDAGSGQQLQVSAQLQDVARLLSDFRSQVSKVRQQNTLLAIDLEKLGRNNEVEGCDARMQDMLDLDYEISASSKALSHSKDDEDEIDNGPNLAAEFEQHREELKAEYRGLDKANKYGKSAEYIDFKEAIWEVQHPEETLPRLNFDDGSTLAIAGEDDDDFEVGVERISLVCPLTNQLLEEPLVGSNCQHVYSSKAVREYIRSEQRNNRNNRAQCAVPGCNAVLVPSDLRPYPKIERKVQRLRELQARQAAAQEDEYETI